MAGPKYPNQQLRSVSLEAYFPGRLGIYSRLGDVQEHFRSQLPNLYVPNANPGDAYALRPFQLRDAEGSRSLAIAVNQVTFVAFKYPGSETFLSEALAAIGTTLGILGLDALNRITYRYENEIGISREDGRIPLERLFPKVLPQGADSPLLALDCSWQDRWSYDGLAGSRECHARVESAPGSQAETLKVSIAVSATGADPALSVDSATVGAIHRVAVALFERLISDDFRKYISESEDK